MRYPFTILAFLNFCAVYAQQVFRPSEESQKIKAVAIEHSLKIDGRLDEEAWTQGSLATGFTQVEPGQGQSSRFATRVQLLYNKKYLYAGVFLPDSLGKKGIRATDMKRDFNWRDHDTFAMCIDGFHDKRNSMTFATNPYGAQKDYLSFDDTFFDPDWNGLWKVRTTRADSGWVAEFEIPWKSLRYPNSGDSVRHWGINFLRLKRSDNEISAWSPYPRAFGFNRMEYAGVLQNVQPPQPSTNIQFNPYTLFLLKKSQAADGTSTDSFTPKFGGELKWAINSNTVLDLTANTDFAQADADVQVNNITRFSVFFPEKRQFFLENASLFGVGVSPGLDNAGGNMVIQPFFSRRIGLDPGGNPIPVEAGARMVYRSSGRNFGTILMRQAEYNGTPAVNIYVGRYSENFGKRNRIGALYTLKVNGDTPAVSGSQSSLAAVDGFFRFGKSSSLQTMIMRSNSTNGTGAGYGGYAQYLYTSNWMQFWWTESVVTRSFNPELGFVSRNDVVASTPGFYLNYRGRFLPYKKLIRSFAPGVTSEFYHQASTQKLIERTISVYPLWLNLQNGGYFKYSVSSSYQYLTDVFLPLGIRIDPGEYQYARTAFTLGSDASRKISLSATSEVGSYYNGNLNSTTLSMNLIPLPHISLNIAFNQNEFKNAGAEHVNTTIQLYTVTGRFALNPRLQLVGLYQRNTKDNSSFYNVRLAWEFKPLSYVYLVLNSKATSLQSDQTGILKVTFMKQF